jgi:hypothetical protein
MATVSDTQRTAIRERKRQAQLALRARHQHQEAAQTAAFAALDRLARQLDHATQLLADHTADPLERAATVTTIAHQLATDITAVRATATDLVAATGLTHADIAELLGTRHTVLFPRPRPPPPPPHRPPPTRQQMPSRRSPERPVAPPPRPVLVTRRPHPHTHRVLAVDRRHRQGRLRGPRPQRRPLARPPRRLGAHPRPTLPVAAPAPRLRHTRLLPTRPTRTPAPRHPRRQRRRPSRPPPRRTARPPTPRGRRTTHLAGPRDPRAAATGDATTRGSHVVGPDNPIEFCCWPRSRGPSSAVVIAPTGDRDHPHTRHKHRRGHDQLQTGVAAGPWQGAAGGRSRCD